MKKLVVVINGSGGVGKDTLCTLSERHFRVKGISSIDPIKEIARQNGWNGEKDAKSRKFLADLKALFVAYNDLPLQYLLKEYQAFAAGEEEILFVHIREGEEIDKFKRSVDAPCVTLLVTRSDGQQAPWGNAADDNVGDYPYDVQFRNDKSIPEAERDFVELLRSILSAAEP